MKDFFKKYKKLVIIILIVLIISAAGVVTLFLLNDEYALTVEERTWIDDNNNSVMNINVINNAEIFGSNGEGVFFDFLEDFSIEYNTTFNPITFNQGEKTSGLTLNAKQIIDDNDLIFYEDHYVLVGENDEIILNTSDLSEMNIGVLTSDETYLTQKIDNELVTFELFESETELLKEFNSATLEYMLVPLTLYLDTILASDLKVLYHFSDIKYYYVLESDGSVLSSVLSKYYNRTWNELLYNSYKENEFVTYSTNLNITETEIHELRSVVYEYGLLDNSPYEIISAGSFGGISAVIMKEFSDFAQIEFNFEKYDDIKSLSSAVSNKEIDIYLNDYNFTSDYKKTDTGLDISFDIIANTENSMVINSLNALDGKKVYVEENSNLYDYINSIKNVEVITYNSKDIRKFNNDDVIIAIDSNAFEVLSKSDLDNFSSRYNQQLESDITYSINSSENILHLLFNKYVTMVDDKTVINSGIHNYYETVSAGNILSLIARYIIILVVIAAIILYIAIRKTKKIKIAKKIKKDDKMKFIDQLTSLKNRNYLNECIDSWDNNTIYPQAMILANLNGVQKLNDLYGYNEGDRQIKSFANALIKTQLDNSEVMRTDGNEFVIYLIGYSQKQITNYIHKLNKEVEKLPYENGAKFGYSMILDNLKSIEDCLNEASNDMKEKKNNEKGK